MCDTRGLPANARYALILLILALSGCGITQSQIKAVQAFSKGSKDLVPAPGGVLSAYEEIHVTREAFETSTIPTVAGDGGIWRRTETVTKMVAAENSQQRELTASLQILSTYADLLSQLSSSSFTDANDKSAEALGKSLNELVKNYNSLPSRKGAALPSIGPWVAAGVEFVGDVYIRHKQLEELRWYVSQGDPLVQKIAQNVQLLLSDVEDNLLPAEEDDLKKALCDRELASWVADEKTRQGLIAGVEHALRPQSRVERVPVRPRLDPDGCLESDERLVLSPESAATLIDVRVRVSRARQLAEAAKAAAANCAKAHTALLNNLRDQMSLKDAIEQIQNFADEAQKANKLRQSLVK